MNAELHNLIKSNEREKCFTYPHIDEDDIKKAEDMLGVSIPLEYRIFLKEFGHGGLDGIEVLGFGVNKNPVFVQVTLDNRKYGMSPDVIAIEDCGEWVYCICPETGEVVEWYQETEELYPAYNSFDEYLLDRIQDSLENME